MKTHRYQYGTALTALALAIPASGLFAQSSQDDLAALRRQLSELTSKVEQLESEQQRTNETLAKEDRFSVEVGNKGFVVNDKEKEFTLRARFRAQFDGNFFLDDDDTLSDTFSVRRFRPTLSGTAYKWVDWRITPELASNIRILDAYADLKFSDQVQLRFGQFKSPIGLERLQAFGAYDLHERGLATELTPVRDVGFQLQGRLYNKKLTYAVGVFNGTNDSGDAKISNGADDFDIAARLFFEPFKGEESALAGLGFGVSVSSGQESGAIDDTNRVNRVRYRSAGRSTIFSYAAGSNFDGARERINPQLYYYNGPFGLLTEYVRSSLEAERGGVSKTVDNEAWNVALSYVLTGEDASYNGVTPAKPFSPGSGDWGAFQVVGRYGELKIDEDAFTGGVGDILASATSVEKTTAYAVGLNWYLNSNVKASINYEQSEFSGLGANKRDEKAILTRLQVDF